MRRLPARPVIAGLIVLLGAGILAGISFGAISIRPSELPSILGIGNAADADGAVNATVFWQLRLPRVLLAILVGSTLAVAGAMMQGLFRNPLADPGLVGVSSGAALGAVLIIVIGDRLPLPEWTRGVLLLPIAALGGAWLVTLLILRLGARGGTISVATLLLAGIAINAFVGAVIGLCTFLATDAQLRTLNFWMLGSLGGASWFNLLLVLPFCLVILALAPRTARPLNALSLGEAEAGHLGFNPETLKRTVVLLTAAGVGGCVAQTGMIGFVGLVVPHLLRLTTGPDHRWLLPGSALLGAALLVLADTLARLIVAPAELPIGILTAAVGAPFFLALLWQQKRRMAWM